MDVISESASRSGLLTAAERVFRKEDLVALVKIKILAPVRDTVLT
jgi:hypothetical protein